MFQPNSCLKKMYILYNYYISVNDPQGNNFLCLALLETAPFIRGSSYIYNKNINIPIIFNTNQIDCGRKNVKGSIYNSFHGFRNKQPCPFI